MGGDSWQRCVAHTPEFSIMKTTGSSRTSGTSGSLSFIPAVSKVPFAPHGEQGLMT